MELALRRAMPEAGERADECLVGVGVFIENNRIIRVDHSDSSCAERAEVWSDVEERMIGAVSREPDGVCVYTSLSDKEKLPLPL